MHPLIESSENDKTTAWDTQLLLHRYNLPIFLEFFFLSWFQTWSCKTASLYFFSRIICSYPYIGAKHKLTQSITSMKFLFVFCI
jgi:hypothetical protein